MNPNDQAAQAKTEEQLLRDSKGKLLTVTVKSPGQTVFSGWAKAITSVNEKGIFDILPYHSNFISLIKEKVIIHQEDNKEMNIQLETGIIKVYEDTVRILIGIKANDS